MGEIEDLRAVWDIAELRELWQRAREALEAPTPEATFRLRIPDEATRTAVEGVYGRRPTGAGTRINVSKLDEAVRTSRFRRSLPEVVEILHDRPVETRESAATVRAARRDSMTERARAALDAEGFSEATWSEPWIRWLHQYGRVAEDELDRTLRRAAAVHARLVLDPDQPVTTWTARTDLAARVGGGAHQLDVGTTLSRVVLRAAAFAHGVEPPGGERERRTLWERCGVLLDSVSATVLCWSLPLVGADAWSRSVRLRGELGLPTHLTHGDLRHAPELLVEPGTAIGVCENPRVLEAAAHAGIEHPLLCTSGHPTTVVGELLRRLRANGAELHHHGDFDWAGVAIAGSLWAHHGCRLWRMSAADYRAAVDFVHAYRIDVPRLSGAAVATPWDELLAELMATSGSAVEEEALLELLLDDLRRGLG